MNQWEERAQLYGATLRGVMFKGAPDWVNRYVHNWEVKFILNAIKDWRSKHSWSTKILDVGCGWGRLTLPIRDRFPSAEIYGIDISGTYVDLYESLTKCTGARLSIDQLPLTARMDIIVCVTVLMYVDKPWSAISKLLHTLTPTGRLVIIEPHSLGKWFQPFYKKSSTGGRSFKTMEIPRTAHYYGGILERKKLMIPPWYCAYVIKKEKP